MRVKTTSYGRVHALGVCQVCGKEWGGYLDKKNARNKAYEHTKATGHTTTAETGYAFQYEKGGGERG